MRAERKIVVSTPWGGSGIEVVLTRKGVEITGWYDSMVGLPSGSLTWAEFDRLRAEVHGLRAGSQIVEVMDA